MAVLEKNRELKADKVVNEKTLHDKKTNAIKKLKAVASLNDP